MLCLKTMKGLKLVVVTTAVCIVLLTGCGAQEAAQRTPVAKFHFDPAARYQTIEGWGGLLANWHWVDGASGPSTQ